MVINGKVGLYIATYAPMTIVEFSGMGRGKFIKLSLYLGLSATKHIDTNSTLMEIDLDNVM